MMGARQRMCLCGLSVPPHATHFPPLPAHPRPRGAQPLRMLICVAQVSRGMSVSYIVSYCQGRGKRWGKKTKKKKKLQKRCGIGMQGKKETHDRSRLPAPSRLCFVDAATPHDSVRRLVVIQNRKPRHSLASVWPIATALPCSSQAGRASGPKHNRPKEEAKPKSDLPSLAPFHHDDPFSLLELLFLFLSLSVCPVHHVHPPGLPPCRCLDPGHRSSLPLLSE